MNPQDPTSQNLPPTEASVPNPLAVMEPNEQIICEIKRHPIGIFATFLTSGLILIIFAVAAFILIPNAIGDGDSAIKALAVVAFFIFTIACMAFVFIANIVYWGNHWVVTSDSLTQIAQTSLFNKQSAQLSLESLEDVTVEQRGMFAQLFNYGTLKAETAGETSKFIFSYCPQPNMYAQKILAARERFAIHEHSNTQQPYRPPQPPPVEQLGQAALADFQERAQSQNLNDPTSQH